MKKMKKTVKRWWLQALRSGEYKQGTGELCGEVEKYASDTEYHFCCLGVLQNIYCERNNLDFERQNWGDGSHSKEVAAWSGLHNDDIDLEDKDCIKRERNWTSGEQYEFIPPYEHLAEMNDEGKSFKQIAQWIERNL